MTQLVTIGNKKQAKIARQDLFIQAYRNSLFNITRACEFIGISRKTYYRWLENDDTDFAKKLDECREEKIDFLESALLKKVQQGNVVAIIFALKCLGKSRGYIEEQQVNVEVRPQLTKEQKDAVVQAAIASHADVFNLKQLEHRPPDNTTEPTEPDTIDIQPVDNESRQIPHERVPGSQDKDAEIIAEENKT